MGTRALVGLVLSEEHDKLERAIRHLVASAANGDIRSCQALLPWIDQALGRPTERVEAVTATVPDDVTRMDTEDLAALVARGREQRLRLAETA